MTSKGITIDININPLINGVEPFINLLNSKDVVKWRREWDIIKLSIYEKHITLLNKKIKKYYKDIEKDERLKKKKMKELQDHKEELRNLGSVHWFSSREIKNKKKTLEDEIYLKTNYISTDLYGPGELGNIERSIKEKFLNENLKEELKFLKTKLSKEECKKYKSGIEFYISIKYFPINNYGLSIFSDSDQTYELWKMGYSMEGYIKELDIFKKVSNLLGEHYVLDLKNSSSKIKNNEKYI